VSNEPFPKLKTQRAMVMEGQPGVADPYFDILLSDVKNKRREGEEGVVTLVEIAAEMGFENRCEVSDADAPRLGRR
jgi:hypothetical protein